MSVFTVMESSNFKIRSLIVDLSEVRIHESCSIAYIARLKNLRS